MLKRQPVKSEIHDLGSLVDNIQIMKKDYPNWKHQKNFFMQLASNKHTALINKIVEKQKQPTQVNDGVIKQKIKKREDLMAQIKEVAEKIKSMKKLIKEQEAQNQSIADTIDKQVEVQKKLETIDRHSDGADAAQVCLGTQIQVWFESDLINKREVTRGAILQAREKQQQNLREVEDLKKENESLKNHIKRYQGMLDAATSKKQSK